MIVDIRDAKTHPITISSLRGRQQKQNQSLEKTTSLFIADLSLVRLLALLEIRSAQRTEIPGTRACDNENQRQAIHSAHNNRALTLHRGLVVPVLHRTAVCRGLLLGASGEDTRESGEEVEIQARLYIRNFRSVVRQVLIEWQQKSYAGASFGRLLAAIDHARARGRGVLGGFLGDCGG
jgi:hypothetical protein